MTALDVIDCGSRRGKMQIVDEVAIVPKRSKIAFEPEAQNYWVVAREPRFSGA